MTLTFIFGGLGSGKTLLAVILAFLSSKKNDIPVKANMPITFGGYINLLELLDFELFNTILIADELAPSGFDSRTNTIGQRGMGYFFVQSRKRGVEILGTSQLENMTDKRFTDIADIQIKCKSRNPESLEDFNYIVYDKRYEVTYSMELKYDNAKQYFDIYKTENIINPLSVTSKDVISKKQLVEIYEESPTKKAFIANIRLSNTYISLETAGAVFDFMKVDNINKAEKLLRI